MRILEWLLRTTPRLEVRPKPFGMFHMASVVLILAIGVAMILYRRYLPRGEKNLRRALIVFGVGLFLLETGKQIVYSYTAEGGWLYNWSRFPFQFCSVPIYVALASMLLPPCKVRQALLCFLATYSPVAGCAVLFYPTTGVFHEILFLNIHTMLWHGSMLLFGLYLWLTEAVRPTVKTGLAAASVYLPMPCIALILNELEIATDFAGEFTFNMFYISRNGYCSIPLLSHIQATAPYPLFFLSYVLLLGTGGVLVTLGAWIIERWRNSTRKKQKNRE